MSVDTRPALRRQRVVTRGPGELSPDLITHELRDHGAIRVRGLGLSRAAELPAVAARLGLTLQPEREGFVTRERHGGDVYGSGAWPADQPMCMHHEQSYRLDTPRIMLVACLRAPAAGGITATADAAAVYAALPGELTERFARDGWQVIRNYVPDLGVPWAEAFGTDDRAAVEAYCAATGIRTTWQADGSLRTVQHRAAVIDHPVTGERCWFNQVAFLNAWTMDPAVREYLELQFGRDGLPYDTAYGDGAPIAPEVVRTINDTYERLSVREPWQDGDLLILDNLHTAHSREPYRGARDVAVAFAEPVRVPGPAA
jgi:alpha-ketoglutarate-dependent taurine dioxygenase